MGKYNCAITKKYYLCKFYNGDSHSNIAQLNFEQGKSKENKKENNINLESQLKEIKKTTINHTSIGEVLLQKNTMICKGRKFQTHILLTGLKLQLLLLKI